MTKVCTNCRTENSDKSVFCKECGKKITSSNISVGSKEEPGPLEGFWKNQSKRGRIGIGVGSCCVGLILIVLIVGMMSPDGNTTNNTTPTTASSVATFNNGIISFQYPGGTQINTATSDPNDGIYIVTSNNAPGNGILVLKEDKTTYDSNNELDNGYDLEGTFKTSDGGSYKKWVETTPTYTNGPGSASFTLIDYEVVKNGNYYEILGTTTDGDIMNQVVNSVK